ncbi:delta and Notch-like epidermal growth factor-related receptor [Ruditapes philippinarum]|uniref:delta and Notch-like epidermal growth factor-related receptor n=1 Tax=Ruditapes philippinarum TaxID=129788 RepID=UPI00295BFE94|nr:delta and Notch-like epidermal growth factor-related receptor [Ruditapes philippinarum]
MGIWFVLAFVVLINSDTAFGDYCTSYRTENVVRYTSCGFIYLSRCTRYRTQRVSYHECCSGWQGSYCSTPICYQSCQNGGTCIRPNTCQCTSSFKGPHCETKITLPTTPSTTPAITTVEALMATSGSPWMISGNETSVEPLSTSCINKVDNCETFSQDMCSGYRSWAIEHCKLYCGLCTESPCEDKIDNCKDIVPDICTSAANVTSAKENCAKFCNLCGN